MFGEHLQDPPVGRQLAAIDVLGKVVGQPQFLAYLVDRVETVRAVFVGAKDAEVRSVLAHDVPQEATQGTGIVSRSLPRLLHLDGIVSEVRHAQGLSQQAPIGVTIGTHASRAFGR